MCLAGDEILMLPEGTLGPIDPQLNGVPARAILRGFERLEKRLAEEGAKALTVYVPLLQNTAFTCLSNAAAQMSYRRN